MPGYKSGKVKWFDKQKGYGFIIEDTGLEIFVHYSNIVGDGHKELAEGDKVTFSIETTDKGNKAIDVDKV